MNGEVENWMQWIDDSNSDDLLDLPDEDSDDIHEFIGGKYAACKYSCCTRIILPIPRVTRY